MPSARIIRRKRHDLEAPRGAQKVKVGLRGDMATRASYQEFGTTHIPERPFMRNTLDGNRSKYRESLRKEARNIILGLTTLDAVISRLGVEVQGDIQDEIVALNSPPNAPSTIRQKGSSNPLIDTGEMRQGVSWEKL